MRIILPKITGHIPEGNYVGVITEHSISYDKKFVWFKIDVEGKESILNICIPVNSVMFNTFASDFTDDETGALDTENFDNTEIQFSLVDRQINGCTYSKFSAIKAVMEDIEDD